MINSSCTHMYIYNYNHIYIYIFIHGILDLSSRGSSHLGGSVVIDSKMFGQTFESTGYGKALGGPPFPWIPCKFNGN